MIPPQYVNTERRIWFIRLPATLFLFGIQLQAVDCMKGITHKVIIFNEACQNGPLKTGAPFAKIPGVVWPSAECRTESIGDTTCQKYFPLSA